MEKEAKLKEMPVAEESFPEARRFIRKHLEKEAISKEIVSETMLVFEALFHNLLEQIKENNAMLRLSCRNSLGNILIQIDYEGSMVYLFTENEEADTPENRILHAYEDKIDSSYHSGLNTFQISVKRRHLTSLLYCALGLFLAFVLSLPLRFLMPAEDRMMLVDYFCSPLERFFGNAALMIGAPVTFFSLLNNLTNTYILSKRYSDIRRLQSKSIITSVIATLLAIATGTLIFSHISFPATFAEPGSVISGVTAFANMISEAVPASIFEPFESLSPLPLIVVALTMTYAFCSSGKYFVKLKKVVDVCSKLFSSMLGLVLFTLPFFFFVVFLKLLLIADYHDILKLLLSIVLILAGTVVLNVFYVIRLMIARVKIMPFQKKLPALLMENSRINSAIDAAPFNIRYCVQEYGMDRNRLLRAMPVLAEINRDGNCFLLMMITVFCILCSGTGLTLTALITFSILIVFLSLGAPNQPGSILIGTMIILTYLGYENHTYLAIIMEVAFGTVQNIINVAGDIVTVTVEHQKPVS